MISRANFRCCAGFSDAGTMDVVAHGSGQRPRSAKARNRGVLPGLWGFDRGGDDDGVGVGRLW